MEKTEQKTKKHPNYIKNTAVWRLKNLNGGSILFGFEPIRNPNKKQKGN